MIDKMIVEGNWWWKKTKKEKQILYSTHFNYYEIKNQNEYDLMHVQRQYLKQNCINLSKINNQNSIFNAKKKIYINNTVICLPQGWVSQKII